MSKARCPKCGSPFELPQGVEGDRLRCPSCGVELRFTPTRPVHPVPQVSVPLPQKPPASQNADPLLGQISDPKLQTGPLTQAQKDAAVSRDFAAQLKRLTPKTWGTISLLGINLLIFVAMVCTGVSPLNPDVPDLLKWGSDYGPFTAKEGQWWRLLTSTFVHIGLLHIALNMWCLWDVGRFTERLFGNGGFLCLYFLSGLGGSLTSLAWEPLAVSAGASGAIFGLYGGLLSFLTFARAGLIPPSILLQLRNSTLVFVGYNLLYGLKGSISGESISMAAHLGGLATGFLAGLTLRRSISEPAKRPAWGWIAAGALALLLVIAALPIRARVLGHPTVRCLDEIQHLGLVESDVVTRFKRIIGEMDKVAGKDTAQSLEKEVLVPWDASIARLRALPPVEGELGVDKEKLLRYATLKSEGWHIMVKCLREADAAGMQAATAKFDEANRLMK